MTIRSRRYHAGVLAETVDIDPATNVRTTTDHTQEPPVDVIDTASAEEIAEQREANQLARIDTALADLKAQPKLVVADFTGVNQKEVARRINALERLNRDLIRLVRSLAADDET